MSPLCGVRAIYILAMCISSSVFDFPLTSNVGDRSLNPKCTYLGCLGPVHCGARGRWHSMLTRRLSHWRYLYRVRVSIGVWGALVWGVFGRSWSGFAHVATVTLSWRVRDFVVIGGVRLEPGRVRFWSGSGFGPGIVGGTGARAVKSAHVRQFSWPKYLFIFVVFWISVIRLLYYVMSCWQ